MTRAVRFVVLLPLVLLLLGAEESPGPIDDLDLDAVDGDDPRRRAEAALEAAEARLDLEPSSLDVQRWAVRGSGTHPDVARRLLRDARGAGALPWVRLRGRFEDDGTIERDEVGLVAESKKDTKWTAELWLEWDLADAVGGAGTVRATREAREQLELRQAIVHQATLAYHDRQRLLLEEALDVDGVAPPSVESLARRASRTVRIRELDATLDALTGGRWKRALARISDLPEEALGPAPSPEVAGRRP